MAVNTNQTANSYFLKAFTRGFLIFIFGVAFFFSFGPQKADAAWNKSYIISDNLFTAESSMSESQIQAFLVKNHSYLASYKETRSNKIGTPERVQAKGKSAAYIINWVAKEYSINPQVILVTLQKEQSLVTNPSKDQYGLDWAMGYGVPDSGSRDYDKRGFSRQVDWGTYQLDYNRDHAISSSSSERAKVWPYIKGKTISIDSVSTYLGNGATASLYRYTPHFHGNQNFDNFFSLWFYPYEYSFVSAKNPPSLMDPGQIVSTELKIKNTGAITWKNDSQGTSTPMRLAIISGNSFYTTSGGAWINSSRIKMATATVTPGQIATFTFNVKAPQTAGAYSIKMAPVITNVKSLGYKGMAFKVTVRGKVPVYRFWSAKYGDHYYTKSKAEQDHLIRAYPNSSWFYQGVPFMVYNYPESNTTPIYRFWSSTKKDHYYTRSKSERDRLIRDYPNNVWLYQGIAFYTYSSPVIGTTPIYRFWSSTKGDHYYTKSLTERNRLIHDYPDSVWKYQGVAFYAPNK